MEKGCPVANGKRNQGNGNGNGNQKESRPIPIELKIQPAHHHHHQATTSQAPTTRRSRSISMSKLREGLKVEDCVSSNSQHGFAVVLDEDEESSIQSAVLETFDISSSNSLPTGGAAVVAVDVDSSSTDTLNEGAGGNGGGGRVINLINDDDDDDHDDDDDDDDEIVDDDEEEEDEEAVLSTAALDSTSDGISTVNGAQILMTADGSKIYLETPVVEEAQPHPHPHTHTSAEDGAGTAEEKAGKPKRLSDEFMIAEDQQDEPLMAQLVEDGVKSETEESEGSGSGSGSGTGSVQCDPMESSRLMSVRLKQMSLGANVGQIVPPVGAVAQEAIDSMDLLERCDFETEQRLTGGIVLRTSSMKNKLNLSLIKSCMEQSNNNPKAADDWPSSSSSQGRAVSSDSKCAYKDLSTTPTSSRKFANSRLSKSTAKLNLGGSLSSSMASCSQHSGKAPFFKASSNSVIVEAASTSSKGAARTDVYTNTNSNDEELKEDKQQSSISFSSVASQTSQEAGGCSRTNAIATSTSSSSTSAAATSTEGSAAADEDAQPSTSSSAASSARCQVNASAQTNERFLSRPTAAVNSNNNNSNVVQRRRRVETTQRSGTGGSNDVIVLEVVVEEGREGNVEAPPPPPPVDIMDPFNADEPWLANCDEENNCSDLEEICTCQNGLQFNNLNGSLSGSSASLSEVLEMEEMEFNGGSGATATANDCAIAASASSAAAALNGVRKRKYNEGRLLDSSSDYCLALNNLTAGGAAGGAGSDNCRKRIAYDFASTPRSSVSGSITASAAATTTPTTLMLNSPLGRRTTPRSLLMPTRDNPPPELQHWLAQFQRWSHAERLVAVDRLIDHCDPAQVRHMMKVIEPQFQRDFISLLPRELALFVLSYLEPQDLLRAAQTCRSWRFLCDDNLLWKEKCRKSQILTEPTRGGVSSGGGSNDRPKRGRDGNMPPISSPWKAAYMRQHIIEMNWRSRPVRKPKVLKGHDDHVITCLQFSGNRIVSGSDDNTLKVWSAVNGKCLRTLVGHTGGVWSSQMSGNIIISGSTDRTLKVWDMDSGACVHTLQGHTSTVRCMHLHGNKVVSGSRDATLRVWNIEEGTCMHVLMGHLAAVRCVQYDGKLIVSGAYDYMVKIWHPERQECLHTLQGHTNRVYSLQFDGIHVVSGSLDTSIRVWDVETGNCKHTLMGHQSLTSGMELRQNILVSGNADSTVKVWDITTGQCLQTLSGPNKHQSAVTCLQFNSRFVVTSSDDGTVKLWDVKTGEFIRNLVALDSGGSGGVVWRIRANDTKLICAVGSRNGTEETKLMVLDFDVEGACVKCS